MENLIEAIRVALRDDASLVARRAGLVACREILAVLEATTEVEPVTSPETPPLDAPSVTPAAAAGAPPPPPPLTVPSPPVAQTPAIDPAAVATLLASLGKLPPEQLLDLAIARLRAALPPGASVPAPTPLRFQLVPIHHLERSK